jgi:hypothetical protein
LYSHLPPVGIAIVFKILSIDLISGVSPFGYRTNISANTSSKLADYVEGDVVRISAVVLGTYSYPTKIGGTNRVPKLQVNAIKYLDSTK